MKNADLGRLGWPGVVGSGLLLFCLSFYLGTLRTDELHLKQLEVEANRLAATMRTAPLSVETTLTLPATGSASQLLSQLDELGAKAGFPLDHLSWQIIDGESARRYEVALVLKGTYPSVRRFINDALMLSPPATLEQFEVHRTNGADPTVEVQARLAYYFAP